jgi:hypothetical protein
VRRKDENEFETNWYSRVKNLEKINKNKYQVREKRTKVKDLKQI